MLAGKEEGVLLLLGVSQGVKTQLRLLIFSLVGAAGVGKRRFG